MDARSMRIPSQVNVTQGHSSRKLHRLATPQRAECKKILPRNNGNTKGTYESNSQECEADKGIQNKQHHTTQRKKVQRHWNTRLQRQRDNILGPDRQIPKTVTQRGYKYIMVMVEIDSNAILVEPMKSRKDVEMIRAYDALLARLQQAGSTLQKHVLDNEVSDNMKQHIQITCKL